MGGIDWGILIMPVDDQGSALHGGMCSIRVSDSSSCVVVVVVVEVSWAGLDWVGSSRRVGTRLGECLDATRISFPRAVCSCCLVVR